MPSRVRELGKVLAVTLVLKFLLICALFASPSIFDTSSVHLFEINKDASGISGVPSFWTNLAARLMAWDAVYFVGMAQKGGPTFEHEYAFSPFWAALIRQLSRQNTLTSLMLTAMFVSLVSHMLACIIFLELARMRPLRGVVNPYWVAIIYSANPGGIFLIAGYTESSCAALTFLGLLLFYRARCFVLAGIVFGMATLLRSNGLLWGICFVVELLTELSRGYQRVRLAKVCGIIIGGIILGATFVYPQYTVYVRFCRAPVRTPGQLPPLWCNKLVPSIYTYVQAKYWNNGFMRYWKVFNTPLFLMALPSLTLLALSTVFLFRRRLWAIALVQLVVLVGLVFFWHVQIVGRISSSLPGPAIYLSDLLRRSRRQAQIWIGLFVVWSITQASLYGAFLPPA